MRKRDRERGRESKGKEKGTEGRVAWMASEEEEEETFTINVHVLRTEHTPRRLVCEIQQGEPTEEAEEREGKGKEGKYGIQSIHVNSWKK